MTQINKNFTLSFTSNSSIPTYQFKSGEVLSRKLLISLIQNEVAFDLTGLTAKIYILKPDNTKIFDNCVIEDAEKGLISYVLTTQCTTSIGTSKAEIVIYGTNNEKIISQTFQFAIIEAIEDDSAIESTNELTALTLALNDVASFKAEMTNAHHDNTTNEDYNDISARMDAQSASLADKITKGSLDIANDINKNLSKIDQTMLTDALLQQIAGTTPINAVPADNSLTTIKYVDKSVGRTKIGDDVFKPVVGSNNILNNAFTDIRMYGFDKNYKYSIAVLRKNYNSSGKTQITIYKCNSDGSLITTTGLNIILPDLSGNKVYYFDYNSAEVQKPTFIASGQGIAIAINLDAISDGTNITSQMFAQGGISPLCLDFYNNVNLLNIINTQINAINAQLQTSSQLTNIASPIAGNNDILNSAITDLAIFGASKSTSYSIAVLRKNYNSSNTTQIIIYECNDDGSLKSSALVNIITGYLSGIRTYIIDRNSPIVNTDNALGNLIIKFTVNLDLIPDATNLTSMTYDIGGISKLVYQDIAYNAKMAYRKPYKLERVSGDFYKIGAWYKRNDKDAFNNLGSMMMFKVRNTTTCTVSFTADTRNDDPTHYPNYNYLAYSVDFGNFISTNSMTINISNLDTNEHVIIILLECLNGSLYRYQNGEGIMFNSITVDSGGEYFAVKPLNRKILFLGDSITEGGSFDPNWTTKPNSWLSSYTRYTCKSLNAVPYTKACMAMGCLRNDSPNVTQLTNYINFSVAGQWFESTDTPDIAIVNIGTNDGSFTDTAFKTELINCINKIIARFPCIPIFVMIPFNQTHATPITELIGVWNNVFVIKTVGWGITTGVGVHPTDAGALRAGELTARDVINTLGMDYFIP